MEGKIKIQQYVDFFLSFAASQISWDIWKLAMKSRVFLKSELSGLYIITRQKMQSISINIFTPKFIPNIIIYKNIY